MKSKYAYAVVDKEKPVINVNDIFDSKNIKTTESEKIIKVEIKEVK